MVMFPKEDIDALESEFGEVARSSAVAGADSVSVLICANSFVDVDYYGPGCYGIRTGEENDGCSCWRFDSLKPVVSFLWKYKKDLLKRKYQMDLFLGIIKSGLEERGESYKLLNGMVSCEHIYVGGGSLKVEGYWFAQQAVLFSPKFKMIVEGKDIDGVHAMKFLDAILDFRRKQRGGHEG